MKTKKANIYLILLLIAISSIINPAIAQVRQPEYLISGSIADSTTKKPLDYITVNLKTDKNTVVKATLTKADGSFVLAGLKPLKYIITLSAIGHQTKIIMVDVTQKNSSLGTILLSNQAKQLKEVSITADKPIIKQEVDRISYDLQADPESKSSSVLEMLRKVPFVSVDGDDNILLKGNSSYKIFINGKPSSMVERNPKDILRSMPASTIQRIEIITTPPAKYDAEGLAGIINIITNKKVDNGYNGTLSINERYPAGPGMGTSFAFKEGKLGVNAYGGGSIYKSPATTYINTRTTTGTDPTNLAQNGVGSSDGKSGYFGTELSYEIDSLNLISGQFNINGDRSNGNGSQSSLLNGQTGVLQAYDLGVVNSGTGNGFDVSLNYQLGFKTNKARLLTFSYRYFRYTNANNSDLDIANPVNYPTPDYNQDNHTISSEQTFQVDYVQPVKKFNMEAGIKGILRDNNSDFQYRTLNNATGQFDIDPAFSNSFTSNQNIFSAYNTWLYSGKSWNVKVGVRIEQTVTDADFISTTSTVHQSYLNIFPSFAISKDFKDKSGINFGFTQRVKRPGINRLNPFVDRSNPNFESSGNPDLRPVLINSFQFGYHISKKASVNIGLSYDFAKNLDLQVSTFNPANNTTYTTYQNVGKVTGLGSYLNINYPITKQWNLGLSGSAMYFWLNGFVGGVLQSNNFLSANVSPSTSYRFDKGWRLNASLNVSGRNPTGLQGSSNGYASTSFSVNKDVVKNKLTFSASANNPFSKYRYKRLETFGPDFSQTMLSQVNFRSFQVSMNYNFGKLKDAIKKTKRGINNDDVSK